MINLHPDAQNNFNEKAASLISCLKTIPPSPSQKTSFSPDVHVKHHITDKDIIGDISMGAVDWLGNPVAFYFKEGTNRIGIEGEDYKQLLKVAEGLFKIKDIKETVSEKTIQKILCSWIKEKCFNTDFATFTDYLLSEISDIVEEVTAWCPISNLCTQASFRIGKVIFEPITKQIIDKWEQEWMAKDDDNKDAVKKMIDKEYRRFQGYTAATLKIKAEKERANEILIEETSKALSFLRIFTFSASNPRAKSICGIWGSAHIDKAYVLYLKNDNEFNGSSDGIMGAPPRPDVFDQQMIKEAFQAGLATIDRLLNSNSLSAFSTDVLDALLLYSRATLSDDAADKLVYILVALESILLKDSNEPIQQNLSERMAFLIGRSVTHRKEIIQTTKNVYGLRSSFIHHGASISEYGVLEKFMEDAWHAVIQLIVASAHFKTKQDFINMLDERKLS